MRYEGWGSLPWPGTGWKFTVRCSSYVLAPEFAPRWGRLRGEQRPSIHFFARGHTGVYGKFHSFMRAFAQQPGSRSSSAPAHEALRKLVFPRDLFSGGVFCLQTQARMHNRPARNEIPRGIRSQWNCLPTVYLNGIFVRFL